MAVLLPGFETSNTARQLLSALAIYNRFSFASYARLFVVEPLGESGNNAASSVSITLRFFTSMIDTLLSFALHTYKYFPSGVSINSLGLSPTWIAFFQVFFSRSNVSTLSHPQHEMYRSRLSPLSLHA